MAVLPVKELIRDMQLAPTSQLICIMTSMQLLLQPDPKKSPFVPRVSRLPIEDRDLFWEKLIAEVDRRLPIPSEEPVLS